MECLRAAQSFSATSFYRAANDFSLLPQCGREGDSKRRSAQKRLDVERADAGFVHRLLLAHERSNGKNILLVVLIVASVQRFFHVA